MVDAEVRLQNGSAIIPINSATVYVSVSVAVVDVLLQISLLRSFSRLEATKLPAVEDAVMELLSAALL